MSEIEELRALIREVIRDHLGALRATESVETVDLSTDEDLAAFVARLLALDEADREDVRAGRKRFRLARELTRSSGLNRAIDTAEPGAPTGAGARAPARRIERGAVTEGMVRDAARAGERLVLGRGAVLTPLAKDRARASGVEIERER